MTLRGHLTMKRPDRLAYTGSVSGNNRGLGAAQHCRKTGGFSLPKSATVSACLRGVIAGILLGGLLTGGIVPRTSASSRSNLTEAQASLVTPAR